MARIFVRVFKDSYGNPVPFVGDALPAKANEHPRNSVQVCSAFAESVGIDLKDTKGETIIEYEVTIKEIERYALTVESPWKPKGK